MLSAKHYWEEKIRRDKMDGACITKGTDSKCIFLQLFLSDNVKRSDSSEDLGVDGKIVLKWIS